MKRGNNVRDVCANGSRIITSVVAVEATFPGFLIELLFRSVLHNTLRTSYVSPRPPMSPFSHGPEALEASPKLPENSDGGRH